MFFLMAKENFPSPCQREKALAGAKLRSWVKDRLLLRPRLPLHPLLPHHLHPLRLPIPHRPPAQSINLPPLRPLPNHHPLPEQDRHILNRPQPFEGECLVCYLGDSAPPTPCCGKPLCNNCLKQWMEGRHITCPHCRERMM